MVVIVVEVVDTHWHIPNTAFSLIRLPVDTAFLDGPLVYMVLVLSGLFHLTLFGTATQLKSSVISQLFSKFSVTPLLSVLAAIASCLAMAKENPHTGERQKRPLSQSLLLRGYQRGSSTRNHTIQGSTSSMPHHGSNDTTDGDTTHVSRRSSNTMQPARNENGNIVPRRAYQHYTARTGRDDPFFSDELFDGMLNDRPNNNHVGSIYTVSHQQEIDAYYRRLMAPRPTAQSKTSLPQTPPPRLRMEAAKPANGSDLAVDDIAYWNPEWSVFVNDDDAEPLLQTQHPDEFSPGSPSMSPQ